MQRHRWLIATVLTLALVAPPLASPAGATVPVFDYLGQIQDFVQRLYAQYQRALEIYRAVQQVQAALKNLASFGHSGEWTNLTELYGSIARSLNASDEIGYATAGLEQALDSTFPGIVPPVDWPSENLTRNRRDLTTTKTLARILAEIAHRTHDLKLQLIALQDRSGSSDGLLKAAQTRNMFASLHDEEVARAREAQVVAADALALAEAHRFQKRASAKAALDAWMANVQLPHDNQTYGPVPTNWPWAF